MAWIVLSVFKPMLPLSWLLNRKCPFLGFNSKGLAYCKNYYKRPAFCKLYPAEKGDLIDENCGYKFQ